MLKSLDKFEGQLSTNFTKKIVNCPQNKRALIIDHEDSFVHTLANYIKTLGFEVETYRGDEGRRKLKEEKFDVLILSPGPGTPSEFKLNESIEIAIEKGITIFGVCLGLQGIVEYFGGKLDYIENPRHGKKLKVKKSKEAPWPSVNEEFTVGLYHSLYGKEIGDDLINICEDEEGILMGVMHKKLKILGVQFHPESILTLDNDSGMLLLGDSLQFLTKI
jgi:anthranilate synthase